MPSNSIWRAFFLNLSKEYKHKCNAVFEHKSENNTVTIYKLVGFVSLRNALIYHGDYSLT
jgi:hypothetical protein